MIGGVEHQESERENVRCDGFGEEQFGRPRLQVGEFCHNPNGVDSATRLHFPEEGALKQSLLETLETGLAIMSFEGKESPGPIQCNEFASRLVGPLNSFRISPNALKHREKHTLS